MGDEVCEVIITAPDSDWLAGFSRRLVEDRICACGQNLSSIRSIYRWRKEIHDEAEARVALHTRLALVSTIISRVKDEHPYEVPCVITLPIISGNPAYIQWILNETVDAGSS